MILPMVAYADNALSPYDSTRRFFMLRKLKGMLDTLLRLDDSPHRIAFGMAIGVFIAWTPTVGIQMILAIPLAWLAGANRAAGLIGVYLSNPLTFLPMYWLEYSVGAIVLQDPLTFEQFRGIVAGEETEGWLDLLTKVGIELAIPMFAGGILLGLLTGFLSYGITYRLVCRFRASAAGQRWQSLTSSAVERHAET